MCKGSDHPLVWSTVPIIKRINWIFQFKKAQGSPPFGVVSSADFYTAAALSRHRHSQWFASAAVACMDFWMAWFLWRKIDHCSGFPSVVELLNLVQWMVNGGSKTNSEWLWLSGESSASCFRQTLLLLLLARSFGFCSKFGVIALVFFLYLSLVFYFFASFVLLGLSSFCCWRADSLALFIVPCWWKMSKELWGLVLVWSKVL